MFIKNMISSREWVKIHGEISNKVEMYTPAIDSLHRIISEISLNYPNGEFVFNHDDMDLIKDKRLALGIKDTSPIPFLFKLYSSTFNAKGNNFVDFWKKSSIDNSIIEKFKKHSHHKYKSNDDFMNIDEPYILFVIQDYPSFDFKLFIKLLKWSTENKRKIVFKTHPLTHKDFTFKKYWSILEVLKLTSFCEMIDNADLDDLIDKSQKVWSFNSGVSLAAVLRGKPVATFSNCDYNPVAVLCSTPEQADSIKLPDEENILRFLSWFYHRFTIDMTNENAKERFTELFDLFYKEGKPLEHILNLDWK